MISIEHESFFLSLGSMSSLFGDGRAFVKVTKSIGEWGGSSNGRAVVLFQRDDGCSTRPRSTSISLEIATWASPRASWNLALRAAAPPLGMGRAGFTIVGDRPTREIPWNREGCLVPWLATS